MLATSEGNGRLLRLADGLERRGGVLVLVLGGWDTCACGRGIELGVCEGMVMDPRRDMGPVYGGHPSGYPSVQAYFGLSREEAMLLFTVYGYFNLGPYSPEAEVLSYASVSVAMRTPVAVGRVVEKVRGFVTSRVAAPVQGGV